MLPNFSLQDRHIKNITHFLIAISTGLLGISMVLMGSHGAITLMTDFYGLTSLMSGDIYNQIAAFSFILGAALAIASFRNDKLLKAFGVSLIIISVVPLGALLGKSMWIEGLGGFPAIGAGQGVIKYFALLAIGITILMRGRLASKYLMWLNLFPVVLVLLWIGGMKFTLVEAQGIESLVTSSPLMSWMYGFWDLQTTSNIIGVYDVIAVILLLLSVFVHQVKPVAVMMAAAVFLVTQTFLITWSSALSMDTMLTSGGHFLIKDLWFLINLIFFWYFSSANKEKGVF